MKKWLVVLALVCGAGVAQAESQVGNGQSWRINPQGAPLMLYRSTDTSGWAWQGDGDGTGYVTERYPDAYQTSSLILIGTAADTVSLNATKTGNPYTASSIQGYKWARVMTFGPTALADSASHPWSVYWEGSPDGITYAPIQTNTVNATVGTVYYNDGVYKIRGRGMTGAPGRWFPLFPGGVPLTLKFIRPVCGNDSTAGVAFRMQIEVAGRQH